MRFHKGYFIWFLLILATEILIAVFVHDGFVRPYLGDFFVVILIYCFVRAFTTVSVIWSCVLVLLFAYFIETTQYFRLAGRLGLRPGSVGYVVLGNSFSWQDIMIYTAGMLFVWIIEKWRIKKV